MNRAHLWNCFDLLMMAALLLGAAIGCGPVHRDEFDGTRDRVTRSRPAQLGGASADSSALSNRRSDSSTKR